ncbi:hypothetical protein TNCV_376461 [Trichonephila clavipes]|nr:hypothetical protein TNCV_376461 [Trichonephila clavipes]
MSHNAIRIGKVNFKTRHMPLSSSMSTADLSKSSSSRLLPVPSKAASERIPSCTSSTGACFQEELLSCLTRVANSEKVRQPLSVESLWLPSWIRPSVISFPQTFTCYETH